MFFVYKYRLQNHYRNQFNLKLLIVFLYNHLIKNGINNVEGNIFVTLLSYSDTVICFKLHFASCILNKEDNPLTNIIGSGIKFF